MEPTIVFSAAKSFEKLFIPGSIALIANAIGFMVIAFVDITVVREIAFVATLGVSLMIISNEFYYQSSYLIVRQI